MSYEYDEYLDEHKRNVTRAFGWLMTNLYGIIKDDDPDEWDNYKCFIEDHDLSKFVQDEYDPYDAYFYGKNQSYEVKTEFNKAWLHHIHNNPHHWQYWVLINDDPNEGEIILDMPERYIIEMICDWWSFSWKKGKLDEIFSWYDERKEYIKLSDHTRSRVEEILKLMKEKLSESDANGD